MPGLRRQIFLTLRGPNNVSYAGYLTLYNNSVVYPPQVHPQSEASHVGGFEPSVAPPANSTVSGKFDGYDQEGAGYYVIAGALYSCLHSMEHYYACCHIIN